MCDTCLTDLWLCTIFHDFAFYWVSHEELSALRALFTLSEYCKLCWLVFVDLLYQRSEKHESEPSKLQHKQRQPSGSPTGLFCQYLLTIHNLFTSFSNFKLRRSGSEILPPPILNTNRQLLSMSGLRSAKEPHFYDSKFSSSEENFVSGRHHRKDEDSLSVDYPRLQQSSGVKDERQGDTDRQVKWGRWDGCPWKLQENALPYCHHLARNDGLFWHDNIIWAASEAERHVTHNLVITKSEKFRFSNTMITNRSQHYNTLITDYNCISATCRILITS